MGFVDDMELKFLRPQCGGWKMLWFFTSLHESKREGYNPSSLGCL